MAHWATTAAAETATAVVVEEEALEVVEDLVVGERAQSTMLAAQAIAIAAVAVEAAAVAQTEVAAERGLSRAPVSLPTTR